MQEQKKEKMESTPMLMPKLQCYWTKQKVATGYFAELFPAVGKDVELEPYQVSSNFKHRVSDDFAADYDLEEVNVFLFEEHVQKKRTQRMRNAKK